MMKLFDSLKERLDSGFWIQHLSKADDHPLRKMNRKGNPYGLLKAIKANPKMSRRQKQQARAGVRRKYRIRVRRRSPRQTGQGFQGFKEASLASAKLLSTPIHQGVEGYHVVNGIRKMWKAVEKWLNENS
jgi:hypothetical protein